MASPLRSRSLDDSQPLSEPLDSFRRGDRGQSRFQLDLLVGLALDYITIADFMRNLEKSDYFKSVELVEARVSQWKDVVMQQFSLNLKVSYEGSIKPKVTETEEETVAQVEGGLITGGLS